MVLTMALVPSAGGAPSRTAASGVWSWYGGEFVPGKIVGGNQFFTGYEYGNWTGTFEGTSYEPFRGIIFKSGTLWALITINFTGSVNGNSGTAVMQLTVNAPLDVTMDGRWVIVGGSGRLKHLHGFGTWTYAGLVPEDSSADYSGTVWLK